MSLGPLMIDLRSTALDAEEREWLAHPAVGGVILFSRNFAGPEQLGALVADVHSIREPSLLVAVDQEGGRVQRFGPPFFRLPPPRSLGHAYDAEPTDALGLARDFGWLMASELRALNVDLSFAPVVDLDLGLSGIIGDRALHSSAAAVTDLALRFAAGMHEAGMAVTAKHFPTHAGTRSDSHVADAVDHRPIDVIWEELEPYRHMIRAGLQAVMVGHVMFPEIDPSPASLSSWWIERQLRGELGFAGAVISDDMAMRGAFSAGTAPERVVKALQAGCDMVLLCNSADDIPGVIEALEGYASPPGQLRLMRLRGGRRQSWEALHGSPEYKRAARALAALSARPDLRLEG
jgi:beta-N-acetylhexosaminidase